MGEVFTGQYCSYVRQERLIQWGNRVKIADSKVFALDPSYFGLYDSYNAPGGGASGTGALPAWKRYGYFGVLWWFYRRNFLPLSWRLAVVLLYPVGRGFRRATSDTGWRQRWHESLGVQGDDGDGVQDGCCKIPRKSRGLGTASVVSAVSSPAVGQASRIAADVGEVVDVVDGQVVSRKVRVSADVAAELASVSRRVGEQLKREAESIGVLESRVRELESKLGSMGGAVMLCGDRVRFESGDTYGIGEVIDFGPYQGLYIKAVDHERRAVRMSDGRLVRLGFESRGVSVVAAAGQGNEAGVQGGVRRAISGGGGAFGGPVGQGADLMTLLCASCCRRRLDLR